MAYDEKDLRRHICGLKKLGLEECGKVLSDRPLVRCSYCGEMANSMRNVCIVSMEPDGESGADGTRTSRGHFNGPR